MRLALWVWLILTCAHCTSRADGVCAVEEERPCQGADGCSGSQRCTGEPVAWSACNCPEGPSAADLEVGGACARDEDCPAGATCLREDGNEFFGGGPARGMCVVDCIGAPEECERFGDAVCVGTGDDPSVSRAFCLPACTPGGEQLDKCGDRTDLACEPLSSDAGKGFCRPSCTRGAECRSGVCDRQRGVCSTSASGGADFGQPCTPNAASSECAGLCLDLGGGYAVCSHRCTYGSSDPCTDADEVRGFCLFAALGGSLGDVGYCAPVCDCSNECAHPQSTCDPFAQDAVRDLLNASGVCAPRDESSAELTCAN